MNKKITVGILFTLFFLFVAVYVYRGGGLTLVNDNVSVKDNTLATTTNVGENITVANPASKNCTAKGGTLKIQKRGDGGEYGLCYFEENRACEEWALYNGDCPLGGRKTTGYDTIDQNYCAWNGGGTFAVVNSKCTFKNGKICSTVDFYNGKCSKEI